MGTQRIASYRGQFRADLQGLRAVAIVSVVLYHVHARLLPGGYVGVDVFFVISGYLITGLLWGELERKGSIGYAAFYARRARRLLPMAMLVLACTMVAAAALLPPLEVPSVAKDGLATATYWANYRFAALKTNYLASSGPASPFLQYWSLGVEEQFYLVWPLLLVVAARVARLGRAGRHLAPSRWKVTAVLAAVAAGSFAFSLWLTHADEPWAFFSLPSRAWELALGGLIALGAPSLRHLPKAFLATVGWAGLAAIVGSAVGLGASTPFPGTAALVPVLGAGAVIAGGLQAAGWGPVALLGRSPLQLGGDISYSWYLWHWPVLVLAPYLVGGTISLPLGLALAAGSGLVAWVCHLLIEEPARRSSWLVRRPLRSLSVGASLGTAGVATCLVALAAVPSYQGHGLARLAAPATVPTSTQLTHGPEGAGGVASAGAKGRAPRTAKPSAPVGPAQPLGAAQNAQSEGVLRARERLVQEAAELRARLASQQRAVAATVGESLGLKELPANLAPPLAEASSAEAVPFFDGCLLGYSGTYQPPCVFGDPSSSTTVVLFGDSHATMWFPAFEEIALERHWRLLVWTKAACPPVDISIFNPDTDSEYTSCNLWRSQEIARIRALHPALVVLGTAPNYNSLYDVTQDGPAWMAGLTKTVGLLRQSGARVLVMGPVESPDWDVPDCLSAHPADVAACAVTPKETHAGPGLVGYDNAGLIAEQRVVHRAGASFVDVKGWFCAPRACPVVIGDRVVFFDNSHITVQYAQYLEPLVATEVSLALLRA